MLDRRPMDSHPLPMALSQIPVLFVDKFDVKRCTKTAFIEIVFFVWCTLIAQIILSVRHEIIPPPTRDHHLICLILMGLQDLRYHSEEHSCYRILCVHNCPSVCVRGIYGNVGCECSWYGVHICWHVRSGRWSLTSMPFFCRELSTTTSTHSSYGIPIVYLHQTSEGGNRLHSHLALLRFAFSEEVSHLSSLR